MVNGENKQRGAAGPVVLHLIVSMVIALAAYVLGIVLRTDAVTETASILLMITFGLLALLVAVSLIASAAFGRKLKNLNVRQANDIFDARRSRMETDASKETRRLRLACAVTVVYLVVLAILSLALSFFCGLANVGTISYVVISMYFLYGLVSRMLVPREKADYSGALPQAEYPQLYALAAEAAGERWKQKKIHIYVTHSIPDQECNAFVSLDGDHISLGIGSAMLCTLDRAELKQVLLHEFAHLDGNDLQQSKQFRALMNFLIRADDGAIGFFTSAALRFPIHYLLFEGQFFFILSSRGKESQADEQAADAGDREKQASALAKINAHDLFVYEQEPYSNLLASEDVPQHMMTDRAKAFRAALAERETDWRQLLECALPSRVDSHPTFRQRWEALGCCEYSMTPAPADTSFAAECWKAAEMADKARASIPKEDYDRIRKEAYSDHVDIIDQFASRELTELSADEQRSLVVAYYRIGQPEKTEELCDQLIAAYDSPFATAFARYWKGVLLLRRYDKAGLDYVYEAMDLNTNYIEEGLDSIGKFCTQMGLQQELDEYRRRAPEFLQLKQDRTLKGITPKANLVPDALPGDWQEKICDFILEAGKDSITHIYLVKEIVTEAYAPSSFIMRYADGTSDERKVEIYDKVFCLLDDWPVDWEFCLYDFEPSMEKILQKIPGSCVYEKSPDNI